MNRLTGFAAWAALVVAVAVGGVQAGAFAPADGGYIVSSASSRLSGETDLSALAAGILETDGAGVVSVSTADTDFAAPPSVQSTTLGSSATTFALAAGETYVILTGDGGANTLADITGGVAGKCVTIEFVDTLITVTDTDAHTADTFDTSAAYTSADDGIMVLCYNGTSWYEASRSVNS